ncbi:MFS transporter [Microbacterium sp. A93]|uniref:MFS transporter n=1 Tax=Microbacterium sp. A93 TaxID=3450716 RepID=UPI003F4409AF
MAATAAFLGILFVGLSLRTVITSISPLLEVISAEVPLDGVTLGIIAAAPTLAYALSGVITPLIGRRVGLERTIMLVLLVMIAGHAVRAVSVEPAGLLIATVVTLFASGVGNVLIPPLIKRHFPERIGVVTAVYVASLAISSAVPALVAVPLAELIGWRASLGVWCVATVVALLPWIIEARVSRTRRDAGDAFAEPGLARGGGSVHPGGRMASSWIAWSLVGLFAMCSFGGFAMLAWMPTILVETAGLDPAAAGSLLSLFAVCGFPIAILVPPIVDRIAAAIIPIIVIGMLSFVVGYSGLLLAPSAAPVLWVLALGVGSLPYPLAFTLIGLRTRSAAMALRLSGFVQAVGYVLAAIGPFTVGILYELTGTWSLPLAFLMVAVLLAVPAVFVLGRPGFVEDEIVARTGRLRR